MPHYRDKTSYQRALRNLQRLQRDQSASIGDLREEGKRGRDRAERTANRTGKVRFLRKQRGKTDY